MWELWEFRHGNHRVARERRRSGSRSRSPRLGDSRQHFTCRRDGERDIERRRRSRSRSNSRERRAPPEARVEHARTAVHYGGACAQTGQKVRTTRLPRLVHLCRAMSIHRAFTWPLYFCPAASVFLSPQLAGVLRETQSSARLWLISDLM